MHQPQNKAPPKYTRYVSPAEQAWLDRMNRQSIHDERIQTRREFWLWERPSREKSE